MEWQLCCSEYWRVDYHLCQERTLRDADLIYQGWAAKLMYGVPVDLPLQSFVGQEFSQICIGSFQVQLHCPDTGWISIEGKWELRDKSGELIDINQEHNERKSFQLHRVINVPVTGFVVNPPRSFTLLFETGLQLTVFDDSKQYESFILYLKGGDILPV